MDSAETILSVLDDCCRSFNFPMLDNGYVYLAATRLSLFRSSSDWAMVIEVFGFSPRSGTPDLHVYTFASRLRDRNPPERYASRAAYEKYIANNPNNESRFFSPLDEGTWQDPEELEWVAADAETVHLRGRALKLPTQTEFAQHEIELSEFPRVCVFELCRYLATVARDDVLASSSERRTSVPEELDQVLQLEEWHHPDMADDQVPSDLESFRAFADVLVTGDASQYRPSTPPNTHWKHWPEGGTL